MVENVTRFCAHCRLLLVPGIVTAEYVDVGFVSEVVCENFLITSMVSRTYDSNLIVLGQSFDQWFSPVAANH